VLSTPSIVGHSASTKLRERGRAVGATDAIETVVAIWEAIEFCVAATTVPVRVATDRRRPGDVRKRSALRPRGSRSFDCESGRPTACIRGKANHDGQLRRAFLRWRRVHGPAVDDVSVERYAASLVELVSGGIEEEVAGADPQPEVAVYPAIPFAVPAARFCRHELPVGKLFLVHPDAAFLERLATVLPEHAHPRRTGVAAVTLLAAGDEARTHARFDREDHADDLSGRARVEDS